MKSSELELSIAIVGDSGVGKSTFLQMFLQGQFVERHNDKIIIGTKEIMIDQKQIRLRIIDICGKEPFRSMAWVHYRTCIGVILLFDLSSRDSYENLKKWYEEILQYVEQEKIIIRLVGNKFDKVYYDKFDKGAHYIQFEEGEQFAATHSMQYSQTSCIISQNINDENYMSIPDIFISFTNEILAFIKKYEENNTQQQDLQGIKNLKKKEIVIQDKKQKINRNSCC